MVIKELPDHTSSGIDLRSYPVLVKVIEMVARMESKRISVQNYLGVS